jgi:hypothetical protein
MLDEASRTLRDTLPPPIDDTPETLAHRDRIALAEFASLAPANFSESSLATDRVLALAHSDYCLRRATQYAHDAGNARKLHAQAAGMERVARQCRSALRREQAVRRMRQANPVTREADTRTEEYVRRMLTEALARVPAKAAPPAGAAEPAGEGPARVLDRPLNLRLWQAHLHAGPAVPFDGTIHYCPVR